MNKFLRLGAVLMACSVLPLPAHANGPRGVSLGGQVYQSIAPGSGGKCYAGRGPSTYQRSIDGQRIAMTFSELADSGVPGQTFDLSGMAVMNFTTVSGGRLRFLDAANLPDTVAIPRFRKYSETYSTVYRRLFVFYEIVFPDCVLKVEARYENP